MKTGKSAAVGFFLRAVIPVLIQATLDRSRAMVSRSTGGDPVRLPFRLHLQVDPEAELGQRLIREGRSDGLCRHDDHRLLQSLIGELVERDEHEGAAAGGRGEESANPVPFGLVVSQLVWTWSAG
ncbi:hypothetical protein [Paracoccus sp. S3-43]|uniref:hypothetical protein n=1 Tax=Paracoccus sp. S3-43 TaxID=3030011 RepID=UPI0023B17777|nr:hypothetical protein [Paracoccus sp. S3-43]WEF25155.1 hypothetical protein PXD02_04210 [Paracoccus sp. S3-43]